MIVLSGKAISSNIQNNLKATVDNLKNKGQSIKLCVIQVGDNEASSVYIKQKEKACNNIGIDFVHHHLTNFDTEDDVVSIVDKYNNDDSVTGILVQLPLPEGMNANNVMSHIRPDKDVDGLAPSNVGNLVLGNRNKTVVPCTAYGIMDILHEYGVEVEGKECVVVGRSDIVGKPVANLLLSENGTVTVCHSKTKNLQEVCKRADILVCAIGQPKFFNEEHIKEGAVVIDVGIHRVNDGKLCGDVDFDSVKDIVSAITPVPGGVGSMTIAKLMNNCVELALRKQKEF